MTYWSMKSEASVMSNYEQNFSKMNVTLRPFLPDLRKEVQREEMPRKAIRIMRRHPITANASTTDDAIQFSLKK